jgi:uncharacterized protein (DUF3084 family)
MEDINWKNMTRIEESLKTVHERLHGLSLKRKAMKEDLQSLAVQTKKLLASFPS